MEEKLKEVEERINKKMKRLERELEGVGKRIEKEVNKLVGLGDKDDSEKKSSNRGAGLFWGMVFLGVGVVWLGNNLGWFYADVPWLAVGLIAGGLTLIIRNMTNHNDSDQE